MNDRAHEAIALHNLAEAREQLGDLPTAHQLLEAAAALNSSLKLDGQWWRNQIALLQVEAKSAATNGLDTRFSQLTERLKQLDDRPTKALFLNERGLWHSRSTDFGPAAADFTEALQLFTADKNDTGTATVLANRALLLERQGQYREAAESWRVAQTKFEALANPTGIALTLVGRGRSLLAARIDLPLAEDLLRRAARNFRLLHNDEQAQQAVALLRKSLEAEGKDPAETKL